MHYFHQSLAQVEKCVLSDENSQRRPPKWPQPVHFHSWTPLQVISQPISSNFLVVGVKATLVDCGAIYIKY